MTIEALAEAAVIADFSLEPILAAVLIRPHDYRGLKAGGDAPEADDESTQEQPAVITVTARDEGEFFHGSGIRRVAIEAEITVNELAAPNDLLDQLEEKVSERLQPSTTIEGVVGRESAFSTPAFKVFGILDSQGNDRSEEELDRVRKVRRVFIAARLS